MKEKLKNTIFIISIIYSITIILLMLYTYTTSTNTIKLTDNKENITTLNNYKQRLNNIKPTPCTNSLNNLINHYENTSYNKKVNIKDKYNEKDWIVDYFQPINNNCNLDKETKESLSTKILTASIQFDEVLQKLYFQYELKIPDLNNRSLIEPNLDQIRYNINRKNQLDAIKTIIDLLEEDN